MPKPQTYPKIQQWVKEYGMRGDDRLAAADFIEIESRDAVNALRGDLLRLSKAKGGVDYLDQVIGKGRSARYRSYQNWAKLMLQWMVKG